MKFSVHESLSQSGLTAEQWNALVIPASPFVQFEFLVALENQSCLGEQWGWIPQHALLYDDADHIIGAIPMYLKFNSYGEFVFDWLWADAYEKYGAPYYPKLVIASPYSPVTGPRILVGNNNRSDIAQTLLSHIITHAKNIGISSIHGLFGNSQDNSDFKDANFCQRWGVQFHWRNQGYVNFDDFLSRMNNRKRKNIKRERRLANEAHLTIRILSGSEIDDKTWASFHRHYCSTFHKLGGYPTLTLAFFMEIGRTMADQVVLIAAYKDDEHVASAFCLRDDKALYGRHWGCDEDYPGVHFESCYYQGIDYCIRNKLSLFEPGAQGEHKISRGFLPTPTISSHWFNESGFHQAIHSFVAQEQLAIKQQIDALNKLSPYKTAEGRNNPCVDSPHFG